jgi:hypothetical protein
LNITMQQMEVLLGYHKYCWNQRDSYRALFQHSMWRPGSNIPVQIEVIDQEQEIKMEQNANLSPNLSI